MGASSITTIGFGPRPDGVGAHYIIPVLPLVSRYFGYLIRTHPLRFEYFFGRFLNRIPSSVFEGVDLLVVNEIEYLFWSKFSNSDLKSAPTYLDLHEDHVHHADRGLLERFAFRKYWVWQLEQLVSFVRGRQGKVAITCVEEVIARSYSELLKQPVDLIYNAPDQNDLSPYPVELNAIKLVHHGMGTKGRGIEASVRSLQRLDSKYTLDLILFSTPLYSLKLAILARMLGVQSRVKVLAGVPLSKLPETLNKYDVSVILLSSITPGHQNSLPNKLFESIHAKLMIVTGPNPSMARIVKESNNGIVLDSWGSKELSRALSSLSPQSISEFKKNSTTASKVYSSVQSRKTFFSLVQELLATGPRP
jgi:glycosyltransferase involved in cell wall biosynthesis